MNNLQSKALHLESLRGFAALIVCFAHLAYVFFPYLIMGEKGHMIHGSREYTQTFEWGEWFVTTPLQFFVGGQFAVSIFFILSGYVLTYKFLGERDLLSKITVMGALVKRPFRLLPLCFVSVVLMVVLVKSHWIQFYEFNQQYDLVTPKYDFEKFYAWLNIPITFGFLLDHTMTSFINGVLWTIGVEIRGSILCFLCLLFFGHLKWRWIVFSAIWIASYFNLPRPFFFGMEFFFFGMLMADLVKHKAFWLNKVPSIVKWVLLLLGLYMGSFPSFMDHSLTQGTLFEPLAVLPTFARFPVSVSAYYGAYLVFFVVITSQTLQQVLKHPFGVWLGSISFSLYVFHFMAFVTLGVQVFMWLEGSSLILQYSVSAFVSMLFALLLAQLLTYTIDKPSVFVANTISKWVSKGIFATLKTVLPKRFLQSY